MQVTNKSNSVTAAVVNRVAVPCGTAPTTNNTCHHWFYSQTNL